MIRNSEEVPLSYSDMMNDALPVDLHLVSNTKVCSSFGESLFSSELNAGLHFQTLSGQESLNMLSVDLIGDSELSGWSHSRCYSTSV